MPTKTHAAARNAPPGAPRRPRLSEEALLGLGPTNPITLASEVKKGFRFGAYNRLLASTKIDPAQLAKLVDISPRTLHRRKRGMLRPQESDRLLRFSRLFVQAVELFEGDEDAARRWLATPLKALSGHAPLELASTDVGTREIEALIQRLEHGVLD